MRRVVATARVK